VQGIAIAANLVLLYVFVHHLGVGRIPSQAILTLPVLAITFFVNRAWSFAAPVEPPRLGS
jgi:putative flippase GtrA